MKVEIINHDHTAVMLDLDAIPRIGETVLLNLGADGTIEGIVNDVEHWIFKNTPAQTQVTIYLKPKTI